MKVAKQIGGRLEQSLCPDPTCTNQGLDVEIIRLISGTIDENCGDYPKDLSVKPGRKPVPGPHWSGEVCLVLS